MTRSRYSLTEGLDVVLCHTASRLGLPLGGLLGLDADLPAGSHRTRGSTPGLGWGRARPVRVGGERATPPWGIRFRQMAEPSRIFRQE